MRQDGASTRLGAGLAEQQPQQVALSRKRKHGAASAKTARTGSARVLDSAAQIRSSKYGDGSCWVYAALAHSGAITHPFSDDGSPRPSGFLVPSARDQQTDATMRALIVTWLRDNDGWARFHATSDGD